jgi:D-serine deaminase-like pyridoxal phosphate-dependent protein
MTAPPANWFPVANAADVPSPSLLIYPDRAEENIRRMLALAGGAARLRPHMKTHKLPALIKRQLAGGITKFKCATIAEAEMTASCGAPDVLLGYQPAGPNAVRILQLVQQYPKTRFSAVVDDESAVHRLSEVFTESGATLSLLLDLDCGMHRCGIEPGPRALELYRLVASSPGLQAAGLHVYDGHINDSDPAARAAACEKAFGPVFAFRDQLKAAGLSVPVLVAGGTPTFPMHARRGDVECSPGTCVLWDFGYADKLRDMDFLVAALVLTRVISKPGGDRLCLDLGHKAIAAENPHPRVRLLGLEDAQFVTHSEEHLVIETPRAGQFGVGDTLYGIPRHICPTVALHSEAVVIRDGRAVERWRVAGRERRLTV